MRLANAASRLLSDSPEQAFSDIVSASSQSPAGPEEIVFLATILARSGEMTPLHQECQIADVASTGGIGSLSTLLGPLLLVTQGATVIKIGVPGRPAGAIDVFAQIPGYDARIPYASITGILDKSRFFHSEASTAFAPLDGKLFQFRKENDSVAITPLIIASLLSKKIAAGVNTCGFDIRYGEAANFAKTLDEAQTRIQMFSDTARLLGISTAFSISNSDLLAQPYIGRGEALVALDMIFRGEECPWLKGHLSWCQKLAAQTLGISDESVDRAALRSALESHLKAQGASPEAFDQKVSLLRGAERGPLSASTDGVFFPQMGAIRRLLSKNQEAAQSPSQRFPDPCGIVFHKRPGDRVTKGDLLATLRGGDDEFPAELKRCLELKQI